MRVLDLFAGAGGTATGARLAGVEHAACIEHDAQACSTGLVAGLPMRLGDVRDPAMYTNLGTVDAVWGSPPCQPFSAAQTWRPRGAEDIERNGWPWFLDVVRRLQPRWCLAENVRRAESYIEAEVVPELSRLYPHVAVWRLDAADYGAPQTRTRMIVVAGPRAVTAPRPTHGFPERPFVTMRRAIPSLLTDTREMRYPSGTGRAGAEPWRLDAPSPTVTTTEVKGTRASAASGWTFHGGPDRASDAAFLAVGRRRLTIAECAALQTFPPDYPFRGSAEARYRQIGNAVPPLLARAVFEAVLHADQGNSTAVPSPRHSA